MSSITRDSTFMRLVGAALSIAAFFVGGPAGSAAVQAAFMAGAFAANLRAGEVDRRTANRAARDAYNASLQDRQQVVRSAEVPRGVAYGETVISGVLTYVKPYGSNSEQLAMVVSLFAGHEIEAIDDIWIGDRLLGALDGSGNATVAPFYVTRQQDLSEWHDISTGSPTQTFTMQHPPASGVSVAFPADVEGSGGFLIPVLSVSGSDVTVDTSALTTGAQCSFHYRYTIGQSHVRVKKYLGTSTQTADADLITASGGEWTTAHRGRGAAHLLFFLFYNEDVFPAGLENVKCKVRGKKIYDPRTTTTAYSVNPALCIRDYLIDPLGFNCDPSEIDDDLVIAAANICDESVSESVWNGTAWVVTTQPRYTCNTLLSTAGARDQNLRILADAMAGFVVWSQGKWRIYAGAYTTPTITLTDDDLSNAGDISIQARAPRRGLFNTVKGTFADALNSYQVTDYPPVTNATYKTQDGGEELVADIPMPAVTDVVRAQRLAKIFLERHRQALTVQASFNLRAYRVSPGDIVYLTMSRYGFSAKPFRVMEREYSITTGVRLTLREEAAAVYAWTSTEATTEDLAPNTTLPDPFTVAAPGTVTLASGTDHLQRQADGTVAARLLVSWPALTDVNVTQGGSVEVELLRMASEITEFVRVEEVRGDATQTYIQGVQEGTYVQVRARARNGLRVRSAWTYSAAHLVVGKTQPPSNVTGLTSSLTGNGILLAWDEATDLDYSGTELRVGSSWNTAVIITRKSSRTHLWGWQAAGALTVLAKHIDSSEIESATATSVVVNVSNPGTPSLQATVIANNVLLNWTDVSTTQPIALYRFKVGSTFAGASEIGTAGGDSRFETYFFVATGTQKIWIQAEDVAGNVGTPTSVDVLISNALGFKLRNDFSSTWTGTKTNALAYSTGLLLGVNTTETWADHFSTRSWSTSTDQVSAGYPIYLQPNTATAQYQEVFDLGTSFSAATTIAVTLSEQYIAGSGTVTVNIDVSNISSTGAWTAGPSNAANWTTSGFRWIRVTVDFTGGGGTNDLVLIDNLRVRASQQKKTETGRLACVSTDAGGTTYTFTETFASIDSIQSTPIGTADRRVVVDYTYSTANPTTCKVLLFDSAGARVSGDVALTIEGFQ
jgi:hypothetical protein